jgi:cytochrome c oxidase assembly factor CtaG/cytochrome c2
MTMLHVEAVTPDRFWTAWSADPGIVLPLAVSAGLYVLGARALWRSAGAGRGVRPLPAAAFAVGWLVLALALVSPLHRLGETLFAAHMVQHELLMALAAPLLVLGHPLVPFVWALPRTWRRAVGTWAAAEPVRAGWAALTHPVVAWCLHGIAIWVWHLPSLYQASVEHEAVHAWQHASFLGTALLFWWTALRPRAGRLGTPVAVIALFTTALHTSLLGALLAFSARVWYPIYGASTAPWGLTPLQDQQLAGFVMWIPAGLAYAVAALGLLAGWLTEPGGVRRLAVAARPLALVMILAGAAGLAGCDRSGALSTQQAARLTGGNPHRGAEALRRFGCGACHVVPGIPGAQGQVGPPLAGVGGRSYIGGVLTNTPDHMVRWIVNPKAVDSLTAMPNEGVTEGEARDIAAYLYTRP